MHGDSDLHYPILFENTEHLKAKDAVKRAVFEPHCPSFTSLTFSWIPSIALLIFLHSPQLSVCAPVFFQLPLPDCQSAPWFGTKWIHKHLLLDTCYEPILPSTSKWSQEYANRTKMASSRRRSWYSPWNNHPDLKPIQNNLHSSLWTNFLLLSRPFNLVAYSWSFCQVDTEGLQSTSLTSPQISTSPRSSKQPLPRKVIR